MSQTLEKNIKESFSTQASIGRNGSVQSTAFEQAIIIIGDTIEDVDIEIEQKHKKIEVLENKIRLPDSKVVEEMKKVELLEISSKKSDRIMDKLNDSLNIHKYFKK